MGRGVGMALALMSLPLSFSYTGAIMGKVTECDDAQSHLDIDWDPDDFSVFTCANEYTYTVGGSDEIYYAIPDLDARKDVVGHKCMNESIEYEDSPPLRLPQEGDVEWPPFEHGSIILLYHSCVDEEQLTKLRSLVTRCLYRHIITPYNKLSQQRPLALVGWGAKLEMARVNEKTIVSFIRKHSHIAPEDISRNGKYDLHLIAPARVVSSLHDMQLCPDFPADPSDPTVPPPLPGE